MKESVWRTDKVKMTEENQGINRKICPSANLSNTNRTWTGVVSTAGLRGEKCSSSDDNPLLTNWLNITKPKTPKCKMKTWK